MNTMKINGDQVQPTDSLSRDFERFFRYYLAQHKNKANRVLHWVGTVLMLNLLGLILLTGTYKLLWVLPLVSYVPAWIGHFVFEGNIPATFTRPLFSLRADLRMFREDATWVLEKLGMREIEEDN